MNDNDNSGATINLLMDHTDINLIDATDTIGEIISPTPERNIETRESQTCGGKNLPEPIIPADEERMKPLLKTQKGFKGNSVVVCLSIFLHNEEYLSRPNSSTRYNC